ncbi:MAG: hypothetical protein QXY52_01020 [Conexivisphaerales archaeon]
MWVKLNRFEDRVIMDVLKQGVILSQYYGSYLIWQKVTAMRWTNFDLLYPARASL